MQKLLKMKDKDMARAAAQMKHDDTVIDKKALKEKLGLGEEVGEKWKVVRPKVVGAGDVSVVSRLTLEGTPEASTAHGTFRTQQ